MERRAPRAPAVRRLPLGDTADWTPIIPSFWDANSEAHQPCSTHKTPKLSRCAAGDAAPRRVVGPALAPALGKGCWQVLSPGNRGSARPTRGPGQAEGWPCSQPSPSQVQAGGRPGGGVMCHGHCQVAGSQAGGAVMSGEGSGRAQGQERPPLRLLRPALPFLSPSPLEGAFLAPSRLAGLPRRALRPPAFTSHAPSPPPPPHHSLPGEGFHSRGGAPTGEDAGKTR